MAYLQHLVYFAFAAVILTIFRKIFAAIKDHASGMGRIYYTDGTSITITAARRLCAVESEPLTSVVTPMPRLRVKKGTRGGVKLKKATPYKVVCRPIRQPYRAGL